MKFGGSSNSHSYKSNPMPNNYRCSSCGRTYAMAWAKDKHQILCIGYHEARGIKK